MNPVTARFHNAPIVCLLTISPGVASAHAAAGRPRHHSSAWLKWVGPVTVWEMPHT